jgi:ketosteroid isomerase-like protein
MSNADVAREYLAALERGESGEQLRRFFTPDFVQQEFPNALNPKGQRSDLASALERSEEGKMLLQSQRYDVHSAIESGESVVLEVGWSCILAISVASLPAGGEMRAHFAVFFDFRDGKIARQRNYDCFEPW